MWGYVVSFISLFSLAVFSFCLFLTDNISFFWLFLELGTLSLVPSFFLNSGDASLSSLFSYLVASALASALFLCGALVEGFIFFLMLGLLLKFGVFPLYGWVYSVVLGSNWFVVWGLSTLLKSPFFLFSLLLGGEYIMLCSFLGGLTFISLAVLFWVFSFSWLHCWCHMMLSSSAALVVMGLSQDTLLLVSLFAFYIFWSSLVIIFLSYLSSSETWQGNGFYFWFIFLLISLPCSLSIFYKLLSGFCIYSCFLVVFCSWVIYSVSEQFFMIKYMVGLSSPRAQFDCYAGL
uniref:NADH dehydrogenase subunit 2 n=1 Tax=Carassotrema koreanum TaxID=2573094 RepID=UPI002176BE31|nr:NADH dehydrogenase subunit 2 [Carassotrema koreanum]UUF92001.1 NADH dehydrogenase subunit 2 [Carassotrema koreanum]